jgi:hypothetical protein
MLFCLLITFVPFTVCSGDFGGLFASVHPDCAARDREFANSAAQSGRKHGVFIEDTSIVC